MKKLILHFVIPLLIVGGGVYGAIQLKKMNKPADQKAPEIIVPAVEIYRAVSSTLNTAVTATGTVIPAKQVALTPEVNGRVMKMSDKIIPGNKLKKGQIIARIDDRDFSLAINQEVGRVQQAELELKLEAGRKEIAGRELKLLGKDGNTAVSQLATRQPQYEVAKQNTESAKSGLEKAQINLSRTVLRAPFNAMVLEKHVDVGQTVGPATKVVTLIGTDELWVRVSVPVESLSSLHIPGINDTVGSKAKVIHQIGTMQVVREGQILRLEGQLDPQNRTAVVLVAIENPFEQEGLPLLSGAFVNVAFEGQIVMDGFEIPAEAIREGAYVWLTDEKQQLRRVPVEIGWRTRETVVVVNGLKPNDAIVTSPLADAVDGMLVKPLETKTASSNHR